MAACSTLRTLVGDALGSSVVSLLPLAGGDINRAHRAELADGRRIFVKSNCDAPRGLFRAEALGLHWLGETRAVDVPRVLHVADGELPALLLEYIETTSPTRWACEKFGRGLAALHGSAAGAFGGLPSNFIGTFVQDNTPTASWYQFWIERRLAPLVRSAIDQGRAPPTWTALFDALYVKIPNVVTAPAFPERLHGDLWAGNRLMSSAGVVLIDPAAYGGHGEVDLAMMRLFGGFEEVTFDAYIEARNTRMEGLAERLRIYQLYPLLVHVHLFGGSYVSAVEQTLRAFVGSQR